MTLPELPALRQFDVGKQGAYNDNEGPYCDVDSVEARERILMARIAEQDHQLAIARQNAELLTGYWKAAVAEAKALRNMLREAGITPEGDDDADGW